MRKERLSAEELQTVYEKMASDFQIVGVNNTISGKDLVLAFSAAQIAVLPEDRRIRVLTSWQHVPTKIQEMVKAGGVEIIPPTRRSKRKVKAQVAQAKEKVKKEEKLSEALVTPASLHEAGAPEIEWSIAKLMATLVEKLVDEKLKYHTETILAQIGTQVELEVKAALAAAIEKVDDVRSATGIPHPKHNPEPIQVPRKEKYKVLMVGPIDRQTHVIKACLGEKCEVNFLTSKSHSELSKRLEFARYDLVVIWAKYVSHPMGDLCKNAGFPCLQIDTKKGISTMCHMVLETLNNSKA